MTNLILAIKIALLGLMNHEQVQMSCPMPNSTVIEQSGWSAQVNLSENNETLGCPISIFIEHNGCLNSDYLSTLKPSDFYPNSTGQATLLVDDEMMPWPKTSSKLRKIPKIHNKKICGEKVTVIFNLTIPLNETRAKKPDTSDNRKLLQFGYGDSYGYESHSSYGGYDHDSYHSSSSFGFGDDTYGYDSKNRYSSGSSFGHYDSYGSSSYSHPSYSYYPSSSHSSSYYPSSYYSSSSNRYSSYNTYSYSSYRPYYYSSSTSLFGFYPNYYPLGFYFRSGVEEPSIKAAFFIPILVWLFN